MKAVPATDADYLAFYGKPAPPTWIGMVVRDGEHLAGFGHVMWTVDEPNVNALAFVDRRRPISPFLMHRAVKAVLAALKEVGEEFVFAGCDETIPSAAAWLKKLGFAPMSNDPTIWMLKL